MKKIAVFASGSGSNAEKIFEHFKNNPLAEVSILLSNKKDALALERAKKFNIPTMVFDRKMFYETDEVVQKLQELKIDLIVLAGFLWLIPENLVLAFHNKIINIHPALLPKYGGKGMYGHHVHNAIIAAKEVESGITIHYVNNNYDEGAVIFQTSCPVEPSDTADEVAKKVQILEHKFYPLIIEDILKKQ